MGIGSANPLLLAASGGDSDPVTRSLRFDGAGLLQDTFGSEGDRLKWTWAGWVKRASLGSIQTIWMSGASSSNYSAFYFYSDDTLRFYNTGSGFKYSEAKFRDTNAWAHITLIWDSANSTQAHRIRMFVNGDEITDWDSSGIQGTSTTSSINAQQQHIIGRNSTTSAQFLEAYLADVHFIDGAAVTPVGNFIESNDYGGYKPKVYTGSFGTNGFHLKFEDSSDIGSDSANSNDFTATDLASHDVILGTPTNNFATWNPLRPNAAMTYSEGNLAARSSGGSGRSGYSTFGITSGKWYFESLGCDNNFGLKDDGGSNYYIYYSATGIYSVNGSTVGSKSSYTTTDIISCAIDFDNETFEFYKNGVGQGQSSFSNTGISALKVEFAGTYASVRTCYANFGQDSSFAGNKTAQGNADSNGYGDFYYTPPSNYLALCSANLDAPSVTPEENFNTVLYTGTRDNGNSLGATSNAVTGVGFNPELLWIKDRDNASSNYGSGYYGGYLFDAVQGTGKAINIDGDTYTGSNDFSSNLDGYNGVSSFDSDGFTVDEAEAVNYAYDSDYNGSLDGYERYVAWGWKLGSNGSSSTWASGNTDPTTEKYNASAGVSVIRQEETSSNYPMTGVTVNHSLGAAPEFAFLIDVTSNTSDIFAWHKDLDANKYLRLNADSAQTTGSGYFPSGCSTATTFQIGGDIAGANGMDGYWDIYLYLFSGVEGYSKFGSYEGNGSSNGPFVYTGFRPRFLMVKRLDSSAPWKIRDAARDPYNVASKNLDADSSGSEGDYTSNNIDLLSNGFKWRTSGSHENHNGHDYIYAAFAESPLKYSNAR